MAQCRGPVPLENVALQPRTVLTLAWTGSDCECLLPYAVAAFGSSHGLLLCILALAGTCIVESISRLLKFTDFCGGRGRRRKLGHSNFESDFFPLSRGRSVRGVERDTLFVHGYPCVSDVGIQFPSGSGNQLHVDVLDCHIMDAVTSRRGVHWEHLTQPREPGAPVRDTMIRLQSVVRDSYSSI